MTPEKMTAFCAVLSETCNVGLASKAIGIARWTAYRWRAEQPDFATAWDEAMAIGVSALEDEAHRRAFDGVDKPLSHKGQFTYLYREVRDVNGDVILDDHGTPKTEPVLDEHGNHKVAAIREYSDTLAIFLLKAHNPNKYRENSKLELSGRFAFGDLSEEEMRAELAEIAASGVITPLTNDDDDISDLL